MRKAVASMAEWVDRPVDNTIHIIKDEVLLVLVIYSIPFFTLVSGGYFQLVKMQRLTCLTAWN